MPPLRERVEDVPLLVAEFCAQLQREKRLAISFSDDAVAALQDYAWPGNVRELGNLVNRLVILYPGRQIRSCDLPAKYRGARVPAAAARAAPVELPEEGLDLKAHLQAIEQSLILQALNESGGVVARAAELLNLRRTTLVEKLRKYGLSAD
jgi:sigma-54 specific flagellar transcriptional regulator A